MPIPAILGAVLPAVTSGIGQAASAGDRDSAKAAQAAALQSIMGVNTPDVNQMKLALQQYQSQGQISPEMEAIINAGPSEMNNISLDPRLKQAQMQALQSMGQLGTTGLRPEDQAMLAKIRSGNEQEANSRNQAILQKAQEQGMGGAGSTLAAQMLNSQAAANRGSQSDLDVAGQASQRALQAIMNSGQLGGQIGSQEFGQQAQTAQAQDVINKYNTMNQQAVGNQNTSAKNAAQAMNLQNAQNLANSNVDLQNQQQQYNKQLLQQQYQNQMQKAQAASGAQNQQANNYNQSAAQTQQMWGGIGQGLGQAASGIGQQQNFNNYMDVLKGNKNTAALDAFNANGAAAAQGQG